MNRIRANQLINNREPMRGVQLVQYSEVRTTHQNDCTMPCSCSSLFLLLLHHHHHDISSLLLLVLLSILLKIKSDCKQPRRRLATFAAIVANLDFRWVQWTVHNRLQARRWASHHGDMHDATEGCGALLFYYTVFRRNTHSRFLLYLHGKCLDLHKIFSVCFTRN